MKKTLTVLALGLALVLGSSCGKYEDGPGISFVSKTSRVANTWVISQYETAGGTITKEDDSPTIEFTKDGKLTVTYGSTSTEGTWEFVESKEKLKTTIFGSSNTETIVQLKSKEMITKDTDGDKTYFVQK